MSERRRIGIFGGTFDPIHNTHLALARAAIDQAKLDEVLFMVAAHPPHKRNVVDTPAEDRYRMVELALELEPKMRPSRIELERSGPSYTADTLLHLRNQEPDAVLFLILGQDSLLDLPRWHRPDIILENAHILALPRPGLRAEVSSLLKDKYTLLDFTPSDCSSTSVRERLQRGEDVSGWIPLSVMAHIAKRGLYHGPAQHTATR